MLPCWCANIQINLSENRITVFHHWSQIEEAVRRLDSLPIDQKKAVMAFPKYLLELLITLSDQGRYTTDCVTTTNYQVFQP